jgi:aminocarboxymuconate-semialdehyde decarboxylase
MDVNRRLGLMDEHGIDVQMLSPNPLTYFTDLDPAAATTYARRHNDDLAEIVRAHPDRLLGAAQLPVQDLDASIAELTRAVRELGLRAAYIDTYPGRALDAPELDAFYEAVVDLDVPLFVHPTSIGPGRPIRASGAGTSTSCSASRTGRRSPSRTSSSVASSTGIHGSMCA